METVLLLFYIVAVQAMDPKTFKFALETSLDADPEEKSYRKSYSDGLKYVINKLTQATERKSYITDIKMNNILRDSGSHSSKSVAFMPYDCGSEKAKEMAPYLLSMIETFFQIPFTNYIISETTKKKIINSIYACAMKPIKSRSKLGRKHKSKNELEKEEKDDEITGDVRELKDVKNANSKNKSVKTHYTSKHRKVDKEIIKKLRSVLDNIIDDKNTKSNEKTKEKFVKVLLEIGDNLKSELNENRKLKEIVLKKSVDKSNTDDKITIEDSRTFVNKIKRNDTKQNKELRMGMENIGEIFRNTDIEANGAESSNEIVLNNNMEIFVRMDRL